MRAKTAGRAIMKRFLLKHKGTEVRFRTESLAELMEKLTFMKTEDLGDFTVIELDAEDLKNSPPVCKTAGDFLKSARKGS
jgi:hypothetical protein